MTKPAMKLLNSQILNELNHLVALKKEVISNKNHPHSDAVINGDLTLNTTARKIANLLGKKTLAGKNLKENVQKCRDLIKEIRQELNTQTLKILPKIEKVIKDTLDAVTMQETSKQSAIRSFSNLKDRISKMQESRSETGAFALNALQESLVKAKAILTTPTEEVENGEQPEDNPPIFEINDFVLDSSLASLGFSIPLRSVALSQSAQPRASSSSSSSSSSAFTLIGSSSKSSLSSLSDDESDGDEAYPKKLLAQGGSPLGKPHFGDLSDTILETQLCDLQEAVKIAEKSALTKILLKLQQMETNIVKSLGSEEIDISLGNLVFLHLHAIIANESPSRYKKEIERFGASAFGNLNECTSTGLERGRAVLRARVDVLLFELEKEYGKEYMDNHNDLITKVSKVCLYMEKLYPGDLLKSFEQMSRWNHPQLDSDEAIDEIVAKRLQHIIKTRATVTKVWS